jgi:hypothetical protein
MRLILVLASLMFTSVAQSQDGHATGNGGGVICIQGKCSTLVEAGLVLQPQLNGVWLPTAQHYTLVKSKVGAFRLAQKTEGDLHFKVFGKSDHFRQVDVVDPTKLEKIKDLYLQLAKDAGLQIDPNTFEVVAFSSDDTVKPALTYLLPKFFQLDLKAQADILIHEGLYRGRPTSDLKYVLQLESAVFRVSQDKFGCSSPDAEIFQACVDQQILAHRLDLLKKEDLLGALISMVYGRKSGYLFTNNLQDIPGTIVLSGGSGPYFQLDPQKLLDLAPYEPRLPYILSKLDQIPLVATGESFQTADYVNGNVDWSSRCETTFYSREKAQGPYYYKFTGYRVAPDANLDFILPE